jgi:hypothetical protein
MRNQTIEKYMKYPFMRGFSKGISAMTFFPNIPRRSVSADDAWAAVGDSFQFVGNNIRKAMNEQPAPVGKEIR